MLSVVVVNGTATSAGGAAASLEVDNPVPVTQQLTPGFILVGSADTVVAITGTGFLPGTVIQLNGKAHNSVCVSDKQVNFPLSAGDLAMGGGFAVTAVHPSPGGGTSPAVTLKVGTPIAPVVSSTEPAAFTVGDATSTLSVLGSGFTQSSIVLWNDSPLSTTAASGFGGIYLSASVPASLLATAGSATVTVRDATTLPVVSNAIVVGINNPSAATLLTLSPNSGPFHTEAPFVSAERGLPGTRLLPSTARRCQRPSMTAHR